MRTVAEARAQIVAAARLTEMEEVSLDRCAGRVPVDELIVAQGDVPPFANSAMDGFAVRSADTPAALALVGEVAAGASDLPQVDPGTAVRIMTGAPMPPGADAVVPLEEAREHDGAVSVDATAAGRFVRAAGHDTRAGEEIRLPEGPITPATVGLLASLGLGTVRVRRRPRVAILSTGDELAAPGEALAAGQIHDANGPALAAAVVEAGGEPMVLPRVPDDAVRIEASLRSAAADAELLIASGGVSVGRHDHVRAVIEALGDLELWRIAVQPGKPLAFGAVFGTPVLGLPGNPVSALVTFELFGRPLLRAMLGLAGSGRSLLRVVAAEQMPKDPDREAYLRVRLVASGDGYRAESAGGQASSQLRAAAAANALLLVPVGEPAARAGAAYDAILLGEIA